MYNHTCLKVPLRQSIEAFGCISVVIINDLLQCCHVSYEQLITGQRVKLLLHVNICFKKVHTQTYFFFGGGARICQSTIQTSVKFINFAEQYLRVSFQ